MSTESPHQDGMLNVAAWQARSVVNGPGERFVLWLQGCPRRCPGCINPDFLPITPRHQIAVEQMAARILTVALIIVPAKTL